MTDRPIIFSGEMVRAILDGRKSQARRIVKAEVDFVGGSGDDINDPCNWGFEDGEHGTGWWLLKGDQFGQQIPCPYGQPGDRLWVRETWGVSPGFDASFDAARRDEPLPGVVVRRPASAWHDLILYRADGGIFSDKQKWRPSIHMPRWAARIWLEISGIRGERVQDISEEDAKAEGVEKMKVFPKDFNPFRNKLHGHLPPLEESCYRHSFACLWNKLHGPDAWDRNDWVWVIEFKRIDEND